VNAKPCCHPFRRWICRRITLLQYNIEMAEDTGNRVAEIDLRAELKAMQLAEQGLDREEAEREGGAQ